MTRQSEPGAPLPLPADEQVIHTWLGAVGPHPTLLSTLSLGLVASIFAHFVFDLPWWWPYAAGGVAIAGNMALAYWQAGSHRVVAVTNSGIHVFRKARWSARWTHLLGSMPRMPLGPAEGRWCHMSVATSVLWVHRKYHPVIEEFDEEYRNQFHTHHGTLAT